MPLIRTREIKTVSYDQMEIGQSVIVDKPNRTSYAKQYCERKGCPGRKFTGYKVKIGMPEFIEGKQQYKIVRIQ